MAPCFQKQPQRFESSSEASGPSHQEEEGALLGLLGLQKVWGVGVRFRGFRVWGVEASEV